MAWSFGASGTRDFCLHRVSGFFRVPLKGSIGFLKKGSIGFRASGSALESRR